MTVFQSSSSEKGKKWRKIKRTDPLGFYFSRLSIKGMNIDFCPRASHSARLIGTTLLKIKMIIKWKLKNPNVPSPKQDCETNSSPLKIGAWETTLLLGRPIFRGYVSLGEGILTMYSTMDISILCWTWKAGKNNRVTFLVLLAS